MTRYGFVIDQRRCIGCHACTVACKMENRVPLGAFRTWVKYIERGTFPDTIRSFSVLRCNQCERAPCVAICPTTALFKRPDGIVDFDPARCIGCKSCMQACPYDALYIDPESHTAAKCNFCAHRVEGGLAPACEVVCPTHAIVSGDLDDPSSAIARLVAAEPVSVRAPEQGTGPNVFYVGVDGAAITPEATRQAEAYLWSTIVPDAQTLLRGDGDLEALAREAITVSNVAHPAPWGWRVSSYLVTKSIASGIALVALLAVALGVRGSARVGDVAPFLAFAFVVLTGVLLVWDLKRPERFPFIFLKPNPRSWLVWGAYALVAFSAALVGWAWGELGGPAWVLDTGRIASAVLAPAAAAYSGFLFNQAEGRDLWQSPLLHLHLLVMAVAAGSAALALVSSAFTTPTHLERLLAWVLVGASLGHGLLLAAESRRAHATEGARIALRNLLAGPYRGAFRWGAGLGVGSAMAGAVLFVVTGAAPTLWIGAAGSLVGIWLYEDGWLRAGQSVPLS